MLIDKVAIQGGSVIACTAVTLVVVLTVALALPNTPEALVICKGGLNSKPELAVILVSKSYEAPVIPGFADPVTSKEGLIVYSVPVILLVSTFSVFI